MSRPLSYRQKSLMTVGGMLLVFVLFYCVRYWFGGEYFVKLNADLDQRMHAPKYKDINSDGIRSALEPTVIQPGDFNVIFLGSSFVHGFILQPKLAPPSQLEDILRDHFHTEPIHVWNFGWAGSSPILSLKLLKDIGKKYHPDLVIIAVDMSEYRTDYFNRHMMQGDGAYGYIHRYPHLSYIFKQVLTDMEPTVEWHRDVYGYTARGYFIAMEPLEKNRVLFDGLYDSLNQIYRYCQDELHVPLVVFIPPRHWQYTDKESPHSWENGSFDALGPYVLENYRYFDEKRATTPYPMISLLDDFKNSTVFPTTFDGDSHWNKHGARLAAQSIFNHLQTRGYFSRLESHATTSAGTSP